MKATFHPSLTEVREASARGESICAVEVDLAVELGRRPAPINRRQMRALDEARWRFLPTTGIVKQVPREDKVPCAKCGGDGMQPAPPYDPCIVCEGAGKVSRVRLVPFVVRSPQTVLRANLARALAHETCEAFAQYAEPRAPRADRFRIEAALR